MKPDKKRPRGNPLGLRQKTVRPLPKSGGRLTGARPTLLSRINPFGRKFTFTWKKLLISLAVVFGFLVLAVAGTFAYYVRDLPNPKKIVSRQINQSTQIVDRNGTVLSSVHGDENRTLVTNDQISNYVKQATVAVEDQSFYTNHGFDLRGIARALAVKMHLLKRDLSGGGSTITQQYIKLTLVGDDHSLSRKIKELILAIEIDQSYTKEEILTGYLNQISYGYNADGIEVASKTYFDKSAKDLTLSEAATLAAIPNAPSYYSPYGNHLDDLFIRKNYILDRMVAEGYIKQDEADKAKGEAPTEENPSFKKGSDILAPHFYFYVREQLVKMLDPDPQIAEQKLKEGGYKVTTSLDLPTQQMAQGIISDMGPNEVKKYNASNAALVATDPKTGEIIAMVGSIDYNNSISGNTNFANAKLQPGSSFKPIVYATAWGPSHTYSPSSITYDLPTDFGGGYKPNNYDGKFRGPVTNRMALDGSLNIPAVKNIVLAGVKESIATAKSMGIDTLTEDPSTYGPSLVLGSGEVTPVQMAGAYGTFANGGMNNPLRPILKIEQGGKVIQDFTTVKATKALEPEVAYEISNVLSDNSSRAYIFGTKNNLTLPDRPVAAKSGTTENNRDAWTIGYTPSISVAVWVGNNLPNKTMTKGADGSYVAAPIWNKFMTEYLKGKPVEQFARPETIKDIAVDKLSGKLPTDQTPPNEIVTDIFAPWQVPKDRDDVHVKVKIVKASGLLATDLTPADQIQEVTYYNIHSELPKNPNWEGPVQSWAKSTYGALVGSPPKENDTTYTEGNRPSISFVTPTDGSNVSGTFTLRAEPGGSQSINQVEYFINNVSVGVATSAPWSITYNASSFSAGSQVIQAVATNSLGLTQSTQISVTANQDTAPPGNVSGASASKSGPLTAHLMWTNPSDSDVVNVIIYQSTDPTKLGSSVKTVPASANAAGSADFTLPAGKYYFTIHPVDGSGNENQSTARIPIQLP